MLRSAMTLLAGTAILLGCASGEESDESEAAAGIDTAAMIAEGAESGEAAPPEDPRLVPVEVRYNARLLHSKTEAMAANLPLGGDFSASGKGTCHVDERAGTWRVELADIDQGNLRSFGSTRWKPEGKPYVTNFLSAGKGDLELFMANNDGKDYLDKAVMSAKRTGDGATLQFEVETSLRGYAVTGTATCARVSPPVE